MSAYPESRSEMNFERMISILIASVTILAAITAFMQSLADNRATEADRDAQALAIDSTTLRLQGEVKFSYDWQAAYQTWREIDLQITSSEQLGDFDRGNRLRILRDRIGSLSPLLAPPYFDVNSFGFPDSFKYEADLFLVESIRLTEEFESLALVGNAWDEIANTLVIQLSFYAVVLALYGLSTTIHSWVRMLFLVLGSSIVIINITWLTLIWLTPLPEINHSAIESYAKGFGMEYQGRNEEAIEFFNQALVIDPGYYNAIYERGNAYFQLGDFEQAARDYESALDKGRNDTNVGWNLGWTYYLLGRFDEAIATNQNVLAEDPSLIGVRMNQALTLLTQGRIENARLEFEIARQEATRQVTSAQNAGMQPPSSLWWYLEAGAADLRSVVDTIRGEPKAWTQSPSLDSLHQDLNSMEALALEEMERIKELAVALELTGRPPTPPGRETAESFEFVTEIRDENGNFIEYFTQSSYPYGTNEIGILFNYDGFQLDQQEVWKVYFNGVEDQSLRVIDTWKVGESGSAIKPITYAYSDVFIFGPGEYTVDLYIDSNLLQSGTFFVENP